MFVTVYGVLTLLLIVAFIGLCCWAYSPKRKTTFSHNANIPFMEDKPGNQNLRSLR